MLLVTFVGAVFLAVLGSLQGMPSVWWGVVTPGQTMLAGLAAALAALAHWLRFHVPITVAAGMAALAAILLGLCKLLAPDLVAATPVAVFLPLGLGVFGLAMWFDSSDLRRQTRRTDIAFWLHLLAAPIIVHPVLMGTFTAADPMLAAGKVVAVFVVLAVVALVVDRRAILVSSLFYLAYAAGTLLKAAGLQASSFALSSLAVGAVVLVLSVAWRPLRRAFMGLLPANVRARLPAAV